MTSNIQMPDRTQSTFKSTVYVPSGATSRMKVRKASYGYSLIPGIGKTPDKSSVMGSEYRRPLLLFLNTYQLDPTNRFHVPAVTKTAEELLDELFTDHKYNSEDSPQLALRISGELLKEVKGLCFNRYRIISVVAIAQRRAQSYNNAITFLWDHERDGYVDLFRETPTAFIQIGAEYRRPMLVFLNTYQLDTTNRFHVPAVTKAAEKLLDELFTDHKYNSEDSPQLTLRISGDLLKAVKGLCFNRYRIISVVAIGQRRAQSYNNAITFLWDHQRDGYVDLFRETPTAFIQVTVFGIYLD